MLRTLSLVVVVSFAVETQAAEPLHSGLQPGDKLPGSFRPLNLTGEHAGEEYCLVCEHGDNPVVMVFAREPGDALTRLLVQLDQAGMKHKGADMGCFAVFLNDKEEVRRRLPEVARKNALKRCVLAADAPEGPEGYKIAADADVTVVLYVGQEVKANHAFKKGQLTRESAAKILADLPRILPRK